MSVAVVTGADSGVGNAFAQVLLDEGYKVYAVDRQVADGIKSLKNAIGVQLDVTSSDSIAKFNQEFKDVVIDLYIHATEGSLPEKKDSLETTDLQVFRKLFAVNTYAPMLVTQALMPNILKSTNAKIGIVTSHVGSITDNSTGGLYAYRSSKAAANAVGKSMAMDLKSRNVPVFILHPGSVAGSELSSTVREETSNVVEAAKNLWTHVVKSKSINDTGKFFDQDGNELPW